MNAPHQRSFLQRLLQVFSFRRKNKKHPRVRQAAVTAKYPRDFRETARVEMHLNGGYTRVSIDRFKPLGGVEWDVPTNFIPVHLRNIGTRIVLIGSHPSSEIDPDEMKDRAIEQPMPPGAEFRRKWLGYRDPLEVREYTEG